MLSYSQVQIFSEDNPDSPVHTLSPSLIKYVQFPPLAPMVSDLFFMI